MKVRRILRNTWKAFYSRPRDTALVLCYHRIAALDTDPWKMAVSPANFYQQMRVLKAHYHVLSLQQLHDCLRRKKFPPKAACITFDDGYRDNFRHAATILQELSLPATFFIVSGSVDNSRRFWWDELEYLLLHPKTLPATLKIDLSGLGDFQYELGEDTAQSFPQKEAVKDWYAMDPAPTSRHELYYLLWRRLKEMDHSSKRRVLDKLTDWAGAGMQDPSPDLPMTRQEILTLNKNALFDIQSHTVSHAFLPGLAPGDCSAELSASKISLKELTKKEVRYLAYPYGAVNQEVAQSAKRNDYELAFTTEEGVIRPSQDHHLLPRIPVPNCNGAAFKHLIQYWSGK